MCQKFCGEAFATARILVRLGKVEYVAEREPMESCRPPVANITSRRLKHGRHIGILQCGPHRTKRPVMRRLSRLPLIASFIVSAPAVAQAQTIYPVDQAQILTGARFDFKVELPE